MSDKNQNSTTTTFLQRETASQFETRHHRLWVTNITHSIKEREPTESELSSLGIIPFRSGFQAGRKYQSMKLAPYFIGLWVMFIAGLILSAFFTGVLK